jgi:hypothetical protein
VLGNPQQTAAGPTVRLPVSLFKHVQTLMYYSDRTTVTPSGWMRVRVQLGLGARYQHAAGHVLESVLCPGVTQLALKLGTSDG